MEKRLSFEGLARVGVVLACASAPFYGVAWLQVLPGVPLSLMFLSGACLLLLAHISSTGRVYIPAIGWLIIVLALLPFVLALVVGVPAAMLSHPLGLRYGNYLEVASGRMINFALLSVFFIGALSIARRHDHRGSQRAFVRDIARAYWLGTGLLIAIGIWQAGNFYLGVPYPFPDTRSHLHSVPAQLAHLVPGRLTSLSAEPSYFAPLVIDFAILSLLFVRGGRLLLLVAVAGVMLALSLSVGGYLNAGILAAVLVAIRTLSVTVRRRTTLATLVAVVVVPVATAALIVGPLSPYIGLVTSRVETALVPEAHSRAFMVLMPFYWLSDSSLANMIFGHGPKSYALIGEVMTLPSSGEAVRVTSNNLYADLVWEHGLLGLIAVVTLLTVLAFKALSVYLRTQGSAVPILLVTHLAASSLYRGDFYTMRFFCVLLIIAVTVTGRYPRCAPLAAIGRSTTIKTGASGMRVG